MQSDENIEVVHLKNGRRANNYSFKKDLKDLIPKIEKEFIAYKIDKFSNSIEMVNVQYYTKLTYINSIASYNTKNLYYEVSKLEEILNFIKQ